MYRPIRGSWIFLFVFLCSVVSVNAAEWKAGAAAIAITPTNSLWLTGFAARTNASRGTLHELYVKALALKDSKGNKAVLVTSDLLGFPGDVSDRIAKAITKRHRISRDRILFNSSHTHGAPALESSNHFIYGPQATPQEWEAIRLFTSDLERKVAIVVDEAFRKVQPATLSYAESKATFGINRRRMTSSGIQSFVPNPDGPMDQSVPVLCVDSKKGERLAIVFGYAAHPTTITTGPFYYHFSGDYAGFAQLDLEKEHPGTIAMFVQGCGGDVMVSPRGTLDLAQKYGKELSEAVEAVLPKTKPVKGPLLSSYEKTELPFRIPRRDQLDQQALQGDLYHRWHAREMLKKLDQQSLPTSYQYPIQAWQFGQDLTLIALAGEVVIEYSLRLKKALSQNATWVAGYSNDVFAYIPSEKVLAEGGYEAGGAMIYYLQPGPFEPGLEDKIVRETRHSVEKLRSVPRR